MKLTPSSAALTARDQRDPAVEIRDWHAHVYFDPDDATEVTEFIKFASSHLGIPMGYVHTRPVGPHPRGSCQLTVPTHRIGEVVQWFAINRGKYTILLHPTTGDDVADHLFHALWLGPNEELVPPPTMVSN
ncbi:DOPA 4,5-dioxygenase family protein [Sphingorhabdus sp. SMR4y]|uniref:DOPA 4,5-dioxygenase family protein n=1 Tax=Sphingorhabdus sp. SMR4y TaxID=2584094 RepID=UPI000B5C7B46|nr:DOPA 4,5-dioxygenase family protein [Sphingorhabdus sp. SMR4y]ASK89692.1 DOPA 4,5-dioxygenase family [Sphingorhabdus sp. SMR4y]